MKRLILALCAILLLSACGPAASTAAPPDNVPDTASAAPSAIPSAPVAAAVKTVVLGVPSFGPDDGFYTDMEANINGILEEMGSDLRLECAPMTAHPSMPPFEAEMADKGVDLFLTDYGDHIRALGDQDLIVDLSQAMVAHRALYDITPERAWKETMFDGRILCFPLLYQFEGGYAYEYNMYIRSDVFTALERPFPTTSDELIDYLAEAKSRSEAEPVFARHQLLVATEAPLYALHRTYAEWPFYVDEQSRYVLYNDGTVSPYIGSEIFQKDAAFLSTLRADELLYAESVYDYSQSYPTVAMSMPPKIADLPEEDFITGEQGEQIYAPEANSNGMLAPEAPSFRIAPCAQYAICVAQQTEDVETAIRMLETLYLEREVTDMLFYGPQGVDWELNADGTITQSVTRSTYRQFVHETMERPYFISTEEDDAPSSVTFAGSGFLFAEASDAPWVNIDYADMYKLRTGEIPLSETETVLEALDTAGYQALIEEVQRQYTEYLARVQ